MPASPRRFTGSAAMIILLLAAGLAVPRAAAAADMTAEERVAILGVYQMECAPLNARLKALLTELSQSLDGDQIAISASPKTPDLRELPGKSYGAPRHGRPSSTRSSGSDDAPKLAFVLAASFSNTPAR